MNFSSGSIHEVQFSFFHFHFSKSYQAHCVEETGNADRRSEELLRQSALGRWPSWVTFDLETLTRKLGRDLDLRLKDVWRISCESRAPH